jgi:ABC-2 type transport system permease protein
MSLTLHAEWTKFRTAAGTFWLLLAAIGMTIGLGAIADAGAVCSSSACSQDPAKISLAGVYLGQVLVAICAVTIMSAEYGTGMIRTTLTAMPNRVEVLTAKAVIATGWALVAGIGGVVGSAVLGQLVLPGKGFTPSNGFPSLALSDEGMLRAASGSVLYLVLIALLSLGISTAVRDSAAGIGVVLGMISNPHLHRHLEQIAPMNAGLGIQTTVDVRSLPLSPWAGLGVLGLWAAGALLLGALVLRSRDA